MIKDFISDLDKLEIKDPKIINKIKNLELTKKSLMELDSSIIGMRQFKADVIKTIKDYIQSDDTSDNRLHSVISGSPGCGKTTLAKILAKIYYSMGIIQKEASKRSFTTKTIQYIPEWVYGTTLILLLVLSQFLKLWWIILPTILAIWIYALFYSYRTIIQREKVVDNDLQDDYFVFLTRADFIGQYIGHTAEKTKKVLSKCVGKIIFIDEAYSLVTSHPGSQDFGHEALTTLLVWLDENRGKCILILGGYEDMINRTVFASQPGLKSRCHKIFHIDEYTGEELFLIFMKHLSSKNIKLTKSEYDRNKIINMFIKHRDIFPYSGRDTERLMIYAKEIYNTTIFDAKVNGHEPPDFITVEMIQEAFEQLSKVQRKNIDTNQKDWSSWLSDFQRM